MGNNFFIGHVGQRWVMALGWITKIHWPVLSGFLYSLNINQSFKKRENSGQMFPNSQKCPCVEKPKSYPKSFFVLMKLKLRF